VGSALAEMASGDGAAPAASGNGGAPEAEAAEQAPADSDDAPATTDDASVSAGETTAEGALQGVMPEMGESVTEGTGLEWHVSEGDPINEGDTIVEVSTDKVDAEVPAPTTGTVTKIVAEVDEDVPVGAVLAEITPGAGAAPTGDGAAPAAAAATAVDDSAK